VAQKRGRSGPLVSRVVFLAFVVAIAALPFAHHDLLCHLKSSTHCATCHIGTSTAHGGTHAALAAVDLPEAGWAADACAVSISSAALLPSAGRSPPRAASAIA
jgi:hypothetical protein